MTAVVLVGAGPGDPDLLTLDAERALAAAAVVVADRSLAPLLDALAATARLVWVDDDRPAAEVVLAALASEPTRPVVRLYRGDPWFHPAGDAERAALRAAGVAWTSVPGVVEEIAALAAAGIPVQLRTTSVATTFVVDGPAAGLALPVDPAHALVVRTADLAETIAALAASPEARDRAAAVVTGSGPTTVVRSPLGDLAATGAGIIVVGLVAALDTRAVRVPA